MIQLPPGAGPCIQLRGSVPCLHRYWVLLPVCRALTCMLQTCQLRAQQSSSSRAAEQRGFRLACRDLHRSSCVMGCAYSTADLAHDNFSKGRFCSSGSHVTRGNLCRTQRDSLSAPDRLTWQHSHADGVHCVLCSHRILKGRVLCRADRPTCARGWHTGIWQQALGCQPHSGTHACLCCPQRPLSACLQAWTALAILLWCCKGCNHIRRCEKAYMRESGGRPSAASPRLCRCLCRLPSVSSERLPASRDALFAVHARPKFCN